MGFGGIRCVGLAAMLTLAACEGELSQFGKTGASSGGTPAVSDAKGQREATVTRNKVRLIGTDGFCIDPNSTRDQRAEAFVVFGNCAAITGNPNEPQPWLKSIVTASVTSSGLTGEGAIEPQTANLNAYFRTEEGRAALSASGKADTVAIKNGFAEGGALYLRVEDTGPAAVEGAQTTYWRGYFDAGTSVVAMSVIGFADAPVSSAEGLDVLRGFVARNKRAPAALAADAGAKPTEDGLLDRLSP